MEKSVLLLEKELALGELRHHFLDVLEGFSVVDVIAAARYGGYGVVFAQFKLLKLKSSRCRRCRTALVFLFFSCLSICSFVTILMQELFASGGDTTFVLLSLHLFLLLLVHIFR